VNLERFPGKICSTDTCASKTGERMWPRIMKEVGLNCVVIPTTTFSSIAITCWLIVCEAA